MEGLVREVKVYEVSPRDGLQNESVVVPVATKLEFISRLLRAGLSCIEVTSLVRPDWVPQLADGDELLARLDRPEGVRLGVLVPNLRGLERAMAASVREIALFASATESFAMANLHRSRRESMAIFAEVAAKAREAAMAVRGYVSMCFGDPDEGPVAPGEVVGVVSELFEMGCYEVSIADTIGVAAPSQVLEMLDALERAGIETTSLAVHFHDTYGQALTNTFAALTAGVGTIDSSAGGLGGCPYAKSATGNLATEDLVFMLDGLGVRTGIELGALVETSKWMAAQLGRPSPSRVVSAMGEERTK
ncbi:MAG: hydroxymethylglutaryl-CoA lyase [Acidimicrobiales bacterium]